MLPAASGSEAKLMVFQDRAAEIAERGSREARRGRVCARGRGAQAHLLLEDDEVERWISGRPSTLVRMCAPCVCNQTGDPQGPSSNSGRTADPPRGRKSRPAGTSASRQSSDARSLECTLLFLRTPLVEFSFSSMFFLFVFGFFPPLLFSRHSGTKCAQLSIE